MSVEFFHQPVTINDHLVLGVLEIQKDSVLYCVQDPNDLTNQFTIHEFKKENVTSNKWANIVSEMKFTQQNQAKLSSILLVKDVTIEEDVVYFTKKRDQEYITLEEYIQLQGSITWKDSIKVINACCDRLDLLHQTLEKHHGQPLVHQSISLRSFLINTTKMRYSQEVDLVLNEGFLYEEPNEYYSSPEQDEKSDFTKGVESTIYSMGIIIFELLTGKNLWKELQFNTGQKKYNINRNKGFLENIWANKIANHAPETLMSNLFLGSQQHGSIFNIDSVERKKDYKSLESIKEILKGIEQGDVDIPLNKWALEASQKEIEQVFPIIAQYLDYLCSQQDLKTIRISGSGFSINKKGITDFLGKIKSSYERLSTAKLKTLVDKVFSIGNKNVSDEEVYMSLEQIENKHSLDNLIFSYSLMFGQVLTGSPMGLTPENHLDKKNIQEYDLTNIPKEKERVLHRGLGIPFENDERKYNSVYEFSLDLNRVLPAIGFIPLRRYCSTDSFKLGEALQLAKFFSSLENVTAKATPDSILVNVTSKDRSFTIDSEQVKEENPTLLLTKTMSEVHRASRIALWSIFKGEGFTQGNLLNPNPTHLKRIHTENPKSCPLWLLEILIVGSDSRKGYSWRTMDDFWARISGQGIDVPSGQNIRTYWSEIDKKAAKKVIDEKTNVSRTHLGWTKNGKYAKPAEYVMSSSEKMSRTAKKFMPVLVLLFLGIIGAIAYKVIVPPIPTFACDESQDQEMLDDCIANEALEKMETLKKPDQIWYCRGLERGDLLTKQDKREGVVTPLEECMKAAALSKESGDFSYWFDWYAIAFEMNRVQDSRFWSRTFGTCPETKKKVDNCKDKTQRCVFVKQSITKGALLELPSGCLDEDPRFGIAKDRIPSLIK